ncbi:hypothetical protein J6590_016381 [Homalodisca vitripennis]|nr:hypothetical protein J6590_016381 [Homalodisca vitripennis]
MRFYFARSLATTNTRVRVSGRRPRATLYTLRVYLVANIFTLVIMYATEKLSTTNSGQLTLRFAGSGNRIAMNALPLSTYQYEAPTTITTSAIFKPRSSRVILRDLADFSLNILQIVFPRDRQKSRTDPSY